MQAKFSWLLSMIGVMILLAVTSSSQGVTLPIIAVDVNSGSPTQSGFDAWAMVSFPTTGAFNQSLTTSGGYTVNYVNDAAVNTLVRDRGANSSPSYSNLTRDWVDTPNYFHLTLSGLAPSSTYFIQLWSMDTSNSAPSGNVKWWKGLATATPGVGAGGSTLIGNFAVFNTNPTSDTDGIHETFFTSDASGQATFGFQGLDAAGTGFQGYVTLNGFQVYAPEPAGLAMLALIGCAGLSRTAWRRR